jgi:hypothetical protein
MSSSTDTIRIHYEFSLDDDDSGGPTGPDYLIITTAAKDEHSRNPVLRAMNLTIYLKKDASAEIGEQLTSLLNRNVAWIQMTLPKK